MMKKTPPSSWSEESIRGCLSEEFPGAWGSDPGRAGPNAQILRSTNLDDDGHINFATAADRWIDEPHLTQRRLRNGDLLLEASGGGPGKPVGRVAYFRAPDSRTYLCSNFFRTLRPDERKVHPRFLAWRLLDLYRQPRIWYFQQQTTGIINLKTKDYLEQRFRLPEKLEQSRIAAVLDTVDEVIEKTEAVIAKLKQVRAGLLHGLLTRGLDENGQLRDPVAHPEQFQDSPLGRIPREWEVGPFRDFGTSDRPYLKTGPFGSSLKQQHWVAEGVPVVTIGSLGEGEFISSEILHVSKETARLLVSYSLLPGDIVFSRVADVGRSVVVTEAERGWIMSSNMMWISVDQRKADPQYLQLNISSNAIVRRQIEGLVNSAGREVANAAVMNSLRLPWAPLNEQKRILLVLHATDSHLRGEQVTVNKLYLLKSGLMNDLLTGRMRVPEGIAVAG